MGKMWEDITVQKHILLFVICQTRTTILMLAYLTLPNAILSKCIVVVVVVVIVLESMAVGSNSYT